MGLRSTQLCAEESIQPTVRTALSHSDETESLRQVEHAYRYVADDDVTAINTRLNVDEEYSALLQTDKTVRWFGHERHSSSYDDDDDEWRQLNSYSSRIGGGIA
jgi:hypothetical protein